MESNKRDGWGANFASCCAGYSEPATGCGAARFNPVRSALDKWIPSVVLYKSLLHRADASNQ